VPTAGNGYSTSKAVVPAKEKNMAESNSHEVRDAIVSANKKFVATFNKGDAAGVAALYTKAGQLLPPNAGFMKGQEAIQAFWQGAMDMGIASARIETGEVEGHGDTAIEVSEYTLYAKDGQELDAGKFIVIWKRRGGQWKLHRDIFNSSKPVQG
jgi:uncharacterized protein (TIGR02246 family)